MTAPIDSPAGFQVEGTGPAADPVEQARPRETTVEIVAAARTARRELRKARKTIAELRLKRTSDIEKAMREGFQVAENFAWISTHDGWATTAPCIDWDKARAKLVEQVAEKAAGDKR